MKKNIFLLITLLVICSSFAFADLIDYGYKQVEPFIKEIGFMTICAVLLAFIVLNVLKKIFEAIQKKHGKPNNFLLKSFITFVLAVAVYFLVKNLLPEDMLKMINANKENMYLIAGIVGLFTIALYKLFGIIECVFINEETRPSDLYCVLFAIFVIIASSLYTLYIRYTNSDKLDNDLKYLTNVIKVKEKMELREDIKSLTLYGKAVNASIPNEKASINDGTLKGNGYEIKSDGTVVLDISQEKVYTIDIFPENENINKLFWWYTHGYLW